MSFSFCPQFICLNTVTHPVGGKKRFIFLFCTVKPKKMRNVYFSCDIFRMLLSDRNLEIQLHQKATLLSESCILKGRLGAELCACLEGAGPRSSAFQSR